MPIKIVIADDHALLRQGIKNVLSLEPDLNVIGEAADGEEAISKIESLKPDILLLDVNMPHMNGLEVTKRLKADNTPVKVIILTIHDDQSYVLEVIKSGADGYLLKDIEPGMLVKAIRLVYAGQSFIYPTLAKRLFGELSRQDERRAAPPEHCSRKEERLTYREVEVLKLIGRGMNNQEIAQELFLSEKTVKNHLTNIFRKISVVDRTQAVLYAIKNKIVVLD
ncbi:Transcriptional regulatory protein DegU [Sporomusa silvacetica DSM 10669]|uniref:Transcriptional regulatory protein DegU n=1 Tax=Sporomusa silvacetica DSM 10669 TaxID=1123289 RepID=A0ABZ3IQW2_9FIRM|nr:response regulator transcription factor [Sporomusa silvacetica]OZC20510.1 transcriptional regulatory protein DegU [Sporomusa silvacetica DSM 10669]